VKFENLYRVSKEGVKCDGVFDLYGKLTEAEKNERTTKNCVVNAVVNILNKLKKYSESKNIQFILDEADLLFAYVLLSPVNSQPKDYGETPEDFDKLGTVIKKFKFDQYTYDKLVLRLSREINDLLGMDKTSEIQMSTISRILMFIGDKSSKHSPMERL
jgi:hypothetical protein